MALQTPALPVHPLLDDAAFRAWGQAIHDAILAVGLVNTADAGQIDFATVAKPASGSSYAGFKMYRFDDSLQATAPVFVKLEFGTNSSTTPALAITVSSGTNGFGVATGQQSGRQVAGSTGSQPFAAKGHIAGATNRIVCLSGSDQASATGTYLGFIVERLRDADGNETNDIAWGVFPQVVKFGVVPRAGSVPTAENTPPAFHPEGSTGTSGSDTAVFPLCPMLRWPRGALVSALIYMSADFAKAVDINATIHGTARDYRTQGGTTIPRGNGSALLAVVTS